MPNRDRPLNETEAAAMSVFRALNPGLDEKTEDLLECSLNEKDNALFTLLMTSEWEVYEANQNAIKSFFEYIKAGWALVNNVAFHETPIQQRAALKILIRSIHMNVEKELNKFEEQEI